MERKAFQLLFATEDRNEGISAFLERRKPAVQGTLMSLEPQSPYHRTSSVAEPWAPVSPSRRLRPG